MVRLEPAGVPAAGVDGSGSRRSQLAAIGFFRAAVPASAAVSAKPRGVDSSDGARSIVSVGGAVTEIVDALGVEDRLIVADGTSRHPPVASGLLTAQWVSQLLSRASVVPLIENDYHFQ